MDRQRAARTRALSFEAEFNGIEVRTVGRQIAERGADALDRLAERPLCVR